ncbi:MAG TPA: hypothetical protein PKE26_11005 [Kiritimatiellia bacterium]|nr:hypothetical protein [Kiritimatiellia bacterium]HMO99627.1 hypothetical protein [Kiritimatiellia bacterium]HMP97126.1 hypothetical protein [Kiritimatiellia bacterium]
MSETENNPSTRKGKVARLPYEIRERINAMIRDGAPASRLNTFLIKEGHEALNDQNWTNWRQGGYQDWLREQVHLDKIRDKAESFRRELDAVGVNMIDKTIIDVAQDIANSELDPATAAQAIARLKVAMTGGERTKIAERRAQIAEEALAIARKKFQRDTCELFLKWYQDQRAADIAAAPGDPAEKMELLGQLIFKEDW